MKARKKSAKKATKTPQRSKTKRSYTWQLSKAERAQSYAGRWKVRRKKYGKTGTRQRARKKG